MIFAKNSYSRLFFQNFPTEILISSKNTFIKVHTILHDRCLCWGIFLKLRKLGGAWSVRRSAEYSALFLRESEGDLNEDALKES